MTLVDCRVGAEEVKVATAVNVPHVHALTLVQDHRHRRVVMRAVPLLSVYVLRTASPHIVCAVVGQLILPLLAQRLPMPCRACSRVSQAVTVSRAWHVWSRATVSPRAERAGRTMVQRSHESRDGPQPTACHKHRVSADRR